MALINALPNSGGAVHQFFPTWQAALGVSSMPGLPDPAATLSIDFDESTNASLVTDIWANWEAYQISSVAGVATLTKSGAPVTIAAPSSLYLVQTTILGGVPEATLRATILALWNGTATVQQQQRALAYVLLKLKQSNIS